jgi:CheY-like chemotaxis protein
METILRVDDEPNVRDLAREIPGWRGERLLEAGNAEDTLQVAQGYGEPIDLLLTNVMMLASLPVH